MNTTDTSEKGMESLIIAALVKEAEYVQSHSTDYDRDHAVDLAQLSASIGTTQPESAKALTLAQSGTKRMLFLHRLQGEIAQRGVIDVLRRGVQHSPVSVDLFYIPSAGNYCGFSI